MISEKTFIKTTEEMKIDMEIMDNVIEIVVNEDRDKDKGILKKIKEREEEGYKDTKGAFVSNFKVKVEDKLIEMGAIAKFSEEEIIKALYDRAKKYI